MTEMYHPCIFNLEVFDRCVLPTMIYGAENLQLINKGNGAKTGIPKSNEKENAIIFYNETEYKK